MVDMLIELEKTWDDIADKWDEWAPPLRPSAEDIVLMQNSLAKWRTSPAGGSLSNVFMLGVTPEIANMTYPFPAKITAMDQSPNMIHKVWPGNTPNRTAVLGNWFTDKIADSSQDVVLADGSFVFSNPTNFDAMVTIVNKMMKLRGIFVARYFVAPVKQEKVSDVLDALQAGSITNFHVFKFRMGMALQKDFTSGVRQGDIFNEIMNNMIVVKSHFSPEDRDSLVVYQNKNARLYFPTVNEVTVILSKNFKQVETNFPTYDFGQCCPTIVATSKIK